MYILNKVCYHCLYANKYPVYTMPGICLVCPTEPTNKKKGFDHCITSGQTDYLLFDDTVVVKYINMARVSPALLVPALLS